MIVEHGGKKPKIHKSAYVAPNATVCGDVTIDEGCAVLFGAVLVAEGAPLVVGANSVVMENAVLRASGGSAMQFPLEIGESCVIGPGSYLAGCTVEPGVYIASGVRVLNAAVVEDGAHLDAGSVVQIDTRVPAATTVPMQHIAFGNPARIYPPGEAAQVDTMLDFFPRVFNQPYGPDVHAESAAAYAKFLRKRHGDDTVAAEKKPPPKPSGPLGKTRDEPPPAQTADVGKVLDVTFYELEEARMRREAALERDKRKK